MERRRFLTRSRSAWPPLGGCVSLESLTVVTTIASRTQKICVRERFDFFNGNQNNQTQSSVPVRPRGGGGSDLYEIGSANRRGPHSEIFFFAAEFWSAIRSLGLAFSRNINGAHAHGSLARAIYFLRPLPGGGGQMFATLRSRTGGQAEKFGRTIRQKTFFHAPSARKIVAKFRVGGSVDREDI